MTIRVVRILEGRRSVSSASSSGDKRFQVGDVGVVLSKPEHFSGAP